MDPARDQVIRQLLHELEGVRPDTRALVAIDGFDGAGKSHLAAELVTASTLCHRPILSVTIDRFHHTEAHRVAAGRDAKGFHRAST